MPSKTCLIHRWLGLCIVLYLPAPTGIQAQRLFREDLIQTSLSGHLPIDNQNWEISQNPVNGYVYFANSAGLVEYNGISSRVFHMPYKQGVRSVYVNPSGIIYTGSFEDFGFWKDDGQGGLQYQSLTRDIRVEKNDEIWNILEKDETIYFQSFTTIYACHEGRIKLLRGPAIMLFLFRAGDDFIVQALGKGLFWFDGEKYDFIPGSQAFGTLKVHALVEKNDGTFWICTANDGIFAFDGQVFSRLETPVSRFLRLQTCNAGVAINDSLFAFGTILKGIVFCDGQGEIKQKFNYANGLNNNTVLSLYRDNSQGLWAGLDEGANYINTASPVRLYKDRDGLLGTVYTVTTKGGLLYLGTNHGLFVAEMQESAGEYVFTDLAMVPNTQGQVWKLFEYGDQLLCGHNDGTFLVKQRKFTKISEVTGGWSFANYNQELLQGTYTGIVSFGKDDAGQMRFKRRIEGFNEPTRYIEVDYRGYVWAVHPQKGIYRLELNEGVDSVINRLYFQSIADTSGKNRISKINNQVVFMTGTNIYAFDYENLAYYPLKSLEAGLGEFIHATQIIPYEKNSYWFMLDNKIALFDVSKSFTAHKVTELIQKYTDLPGREQQIIALDKNTMLVPTRMAFTIFDLSTRYESKDLKAPIITRLVFSGRNKSTMIIPGRIKKAHVPSYRNNLTVYFADPSRYDLDNKEFLYRIPDLDETWHLTDQDNFGFLNLKSGTYRLQVRLSVEENTAETTFTIRRPWYLSIGAGLFYILALAGMSLLGIRIFRNALSRHRMLIEYEVSRNKLENELDYKSYELMLTMRYLIRKTDILKELQAQILSLKRESSNYPVKYIREMERIINEGLNSQTEEWKNAMNNLKLSQEGFFRKLKEKFPGLTPNDLRLSSYLRMNFTTKEIAHLLNVSGRAVEIGRYRLRRKMHLDHHMNLTEFLMQQAEEEQ